MKQLLVRATALEKDYALGSSTQIALRDATCDVPAGARIAVVGPSGSGKTTLLHLLGGLDDPTHGVVEWPALGRKGALRPGPVAFVFQAPSLLPALTVVENVELPLLLMRVDPASARAQATRMLDAMDLSHLADALPEELSGGQAQRSACARALITQPRLLLADEPTAQLDQPSARSLMTAVTSHLDATGAALLLATHDAAIAASFPDVWSIAHGVLSCSP